MFTWLKRRLRPPYIEFIGITLLLVISIFGLLAIRVYNTQKIAKKITYFEDIAYLDSLIALENTKPSFNKTLNNFEENEFFSRNDYSGKSFFNYYKKDSFYKPYDKENNSLKTVLIYNINTADSFELEKLRGIGTKLASRIVKYRDALGGFNSINQLKEIYGLDSTILKTLSINVNKAEVKKIEVNNTTLDRLKKHPYIRYKYATCLYNYIMQNKPLTIDKWDKIVCIPKSDKLKILPYLSFN